MEDKGLWKHEGSKPKKAPKKPKTKNSVMDTTCTQSGEDWEWKTEGFSWRWSPGVGLNLRMHTGTREIPHVYCRTLDLAVQHSWGFVIGFNQGTRSERSTGPGTDVPPREEPTFGTGDANAKAEEATE